MYSEERDLISSWGRITTIRMWSKVFPTTISEESEAFIQACQSPGLLSFCGTWACNSRHILKSLDVGFDPGQYPGEESIGKPGRIPDDSAAVTGMGQVCLRPIPRVD